MEIQHPIEHPINPIFVTRENICDLCDVDLINQLIFRCDLCDYDLCSKCYTKIYKTDYKGKKKIIPDDRAYGKNEYCYHTPTVPIPINKGRGGKNVS